MKPFNPKPGQPGSRIEWKQLGEIDGTYEWIDRAGEVWDRAAWPASVYVIPDELWPDEAVVIVGIGKRNAGRVIETVNRAAQRRHVQLVDRFRRDCRLVAATQPYTAYEGGFKVQQTRHRLHAIGCGCDLTGWSVSDPQRHEWVIDVARGVQTRPLNRPGFAECVMAVPE